jgi:hypothetical protein
MTKDFIICTLHHILLKVLKLHMRWTGHVACMRDETCIQNFSQIKERNELQDQCKDVKQNMDHKAGLNYNLMTMVWLCRIPLVEYRAMT